MSNNPYIDQLLREWAWEYYLGCASAVCTTASLRYIHDNGMDVFSCLLIVVIVGGVPGTFGGLIGSWMKNRELKRVLKLERRLPFGPESPFANINPNGNPADDSFWRH